MFNKPYLIFIILLLISLSCNKKPQKVEIQKIINIDDTSVLQKNKIYVKYKIPLPLDLFNFFLEDVEFDESFLLPTDITNLCSKHTHKALVLGIANADLAYCAITDHNQLSSLYFEISKNLAADLGINVGYTEELYKRFIENINNKDSIQKIVDEAYWKTCNYLEENNKYNILPFIIASGWYESVYLLIKSKNAEKYSQQVKDIILQQEDGFKRVQKFLYDAQMQTSASYYYDDIKKIILNIQKILDLYKGYYVKVNEKEKYYNSIISTIFEQKANFINGKF